jgi:NADPH:quinone reductase-like Zn-dependent oxidoreductase
VLARHLAPLFASRRLTPVIHKEFSLDEANEALALVAQNEGFGKVVLRCHPGGG